MSTLILFLVAIFALAVVAGFTTAIVAYATNNQVNLGLVFLSAFVLGPLAGLIIAALYIWSKPESAKPEAKQTETNFVGEETKQ